MNRGSGNEGKKGGRLKILRFSFICALCVLFLMLLVKLHVSKLRYEELRSEVLRLRSVVIESYVFDGGEKTVIDEIDRILDEM